MPNRSASMGAHLAMSLRVAAVVMVLGYTVLAAEQRLAQDISPEEIVAAETAPAFGVQSSPSNRTVAARAAEPAQTASR
jgi:hypothetical protein